MVNNHSAAYGMSKIFDESGSYVPGANIAGFLKVADAIMTQGVHSRKRNKPPDGGIKPLFFILTLNNHVFRRILDPW